MAERIINRKVKFVMKSLLLNIIKSIGLVVVSVLIGFGLLVVVYMLPTERIEKNLYASEPVLTKEGDGPKIWWFYSTVIDNHADIIWALMATDDNNVSLLDKVLLNYWKKTVTRGEMDTPVVSLHNLATDELMYAAQLDQDNIFEKDTGYIYNEYARYWHGIQIILKPLLAIFPYSVIRILILCIGVSLVVAVFIKLRKLSFSILAWGYLLGMFSINAIIGGLCLEYSMDYLVINIGVLILIYLYESPRGIQVFAENNNGICVPKECFAIFTILGILTAYLSFFAYPTTTLFVPLIFFIFFTDVNNGDTTRLTFIHKILKIVQLGLAWGIGYAGMWGGKWILASALTDENVILNAMKSIAYRTNGRPVSYFMTVVLNVGAYLINPIPLIMFAILISLIVKNGENIKRMWRYNIIYLLLMLVPFVWYFLVTEHSNTHFWFTFKNLIISAISTFAFMELVQKDN